jgi:hypothetical protein
MLNRKLPAIHSICIWGTIREHTLFDLNSKESFEIDGVGYPPGVEWMGFFQLQQQSNGKYKILRKIYL